MSQSGPARIARRHVAVALLAVLACAGAALAGLGWQAFGDADGAVSGGARVSDVDVPAVANLQPRLRAALRRAAADAARVGVEIRVASGWRSPAYQTRLLRQAVAKHGSPMYADPRRDPRMEP